MAGAVSDTPFPQLHRSWLHLVRHHILLESVSLDPSAIVLEYCVNHQSPKLAQRENCIQPGVPLATFFWFPNRSRQFVNQKIVQRAECSLNYAFEIRAKRTGIVDADSE